MVFQWAMDFIADYENRERELMKTILKLPLKEQACYQDQVIHHFTLKANEGDQRACDFIREQVERSFTMIDRRYQKWNSCSVGGLASIAYHTTDKDIKRKALALLHEFAEWLESN